MLTNSRAAFHRALSALSTSLTAEMAAMRSAGTHKTERVITSAQGARVSVASSPAPVLNMCANNYLGLSNHPALVAAAKAALDSHGFGLSSVRFICGTQDIHKRLEARIAAFHGMEDAILFPSCFDANAGIFEAILKEGDAVISDEKNHASISECAGEPSSSRHFQALTSWAARSRQTPRPSLPFPLSPAHPLRS
jgi:glycine C-acetyltransferase